MTTSNLPLADSTIALTSGRASLWAILVGVNIYQDPQIADLRFSAADCRDLAAVLTTATRHFPKKQILIHHDTEDRLPLQKTVADSITQVVAQAKPQDTVLFYFSGHGLIEPEQQQAVLCLGDTQSDRLLDTGLPMHQLLQWLNQCESRQQLIWLDACHSGELMLPGARNVVLDTAVETTTVLVKLLQRQTSRNRGFYALLSCDQGQRSWEFPELGHGLFTYYLIQGLQGAAADASGVISADGLYQYLYQQITQFIDQKNQAIRRLNQQQLQQGETLLHPEYPLQTPKRIVDGVGNVVIGLQRLTSEKPREKPRQTPDSTEQRQLAVQPADFSIIPLTFWRSAGWGFAAALAIGGLYSGVRLLSKPDAVPNDSLPSTDGSAACNARIELIEPSPKQILEPQMLLNDCKTEPPWKPARVRALLEGNPVWGVAFSPDQPLLVSAGGKGGEIWNLANNQKTYVLGGHTDSVYGIAISPDSQQVATASADQTARIWNINRGTVEHILKGHQAAVWSVQFSPDGEIVATASEDGTVKLWEVKTGALRYTYTAHQGRVFVVAFNPIEGWIASAGQDGQIRLWNQDGTELKTLSGHQDAIRALAFSRDGSKLASTSWDGTVKLWNGQTGELLHTLAGHADRVLTVAFSPDGRTLASGSRTAAFDPLQPDLNRGNTDATIKLWNVENGQLIGTLYAQAGWILSLAFSPDGSTLASGSNDQTILLWQK